VGERKVHFCDKTISSCCFRFPLPLSLLVRRGCVRRGIALGLVSLRGVVVLLRRRVSSWLLRRISSLLLGRVSLLLWRICLLLGRVPLLLLLTGVTLLSGVALLRGVGGGGRADIVVGLLCLIRRLGTVNDSWLHDNSRLDHGRTGVDHLVAESPQLLMVVVMTSFAKKKGKKERQLSLPIRESRPKKKKAAAAAKEEFCSAAPRRLKRRKREWLT